MHQYAYLKLINTIKWVWLEVGGWEVALNNRWEVGLVGDGL